MKCKDLVEYEHAVEKSPEGGFAPWDSLDLLALEMIPPEIKKSDVSRLNVSEAHELFSEGMRGRTARSLLAKDLSASRMHTRFYQSLLDHQVELLARNKGDVKKARFYNELVAQQHRRMVATADLMLRTERQPAPSFRVSAEQAAFLVESNSKERN